MPTQLFLYRQDYHLDALVSRTGVGHRDLVRFRRENFPGESGVIFRAEVVEMLAEAMDIALRHVQHLPRPVIVSRLNSNPRFVHLVCGPEKKPAILRVLKRQGFFLGLELDPTSLTLSHSPHEQDLWLWLSPQPPPRPAPKKNAALTPPAPTSENSAISGPNPISLPANAFTLWTNELA